MKKSSFNRLFDLSGKTAVITGGAGILGKVFCEALAANGADIAVVDLHEDAAQPLASEISDSYGVNAFGFACDVSNPASVSAMVNKVEERFKGIDILLNNAATKSKDLNAFFAPYETFDYSAWKEIMSVNIDGMFLVAQAVGNSMLRQNRGGSIIQTSSIYGVVAPDQRIYEGSHYLGRQINTPAVYTVSKAAVVGLTKYLATYWASQNIRVNTLVPGGVESGQNEEFRKRYSARIPMGRMAQAEELVGAVLYLASDASSYVTGQEIIVDGGLTAW